LILRISILVLINLLSFNSHSSPHKFDFSGGFQARSLPSTGVELYGDGGLNYLIWGKKETPKDVLYGLVRPSFGASTSGVINQVRGEIEIFPISFLGFSFGRQIIHSNFDFKFFECEKVSCKGTYERNYVETKMVIGHNGWFLAGNYKIDRVNSPNDGAPMADWRNVIIGKPEREIQIDKRVIAGKLFSNKMIGVMLDNVQFLGSRERKESFIGVYQITKKENTYLFGAGVLHSDRQPMGLQLYFKLHHISLRSLKLF
jgi:hypothetical protein